MIILLPDTPRACNEGQEGQKKDPHSYEKPTKRNYSRSARYDDAFSFDFDFVTTSIAFVLIVKTLKFGQKGGKWMKKEEFVLLDLILMAGFY